jgi:hypothetical protein
MIMFFVGCFVGFLLGVVVMGTIRSDCPECRMLEQENTLLRESNGHLRNELHERNGNLRVIQ